MRDGLDDCLNESWASLSGCPRASACVRTRHQWPGEGRAGGCCAGRWAIRSRWRRCC